MFQVDLSILPNNAQEQLIDFYQFLIEKYTKQQCEVDIKQANLNLALIGINEQPKNNHFEDLFGILTAKQGVSLQAMEEVIAQQALERFNDCN